MGSVGGGVWKTTNAGRTWNPIFDSQPIASIGAIGVAPSAPDTVYVGTGEADMRSQISYGNGMYKSTDAGRTWTHIGLDATRQIGKVIVDPRDPNVVFVAALGHVYGANPDRGVYRTRDGGATWQKVLFKNNDVGAIDLAFDPTSSQVLYAVMWNTKRPPWSIYPPSYGPGSGLYKSTDGGANWQQLTNGLPSDGLGRIGVAVAASNRNRVYAIVDAKDGGMYRSDDAGATFRKVSGDDNRIWGRGWYFGKIVVDPKNPDLVYSSNTGVYRSRDGGRTWGEPFKGSPGGDDYHFVWVNPKHPDHIATGSDQGAVVSVNGGKSWSGWYNQPTGQFYHLAADDQFPYWVYSGQQDSGTAGVASRSDYGAISFREWHPVGGDERDYDVPDPSDALTIYASGLGGNLRRFDTRTGQSAAIDPNVVSAYAQKATTVKYRYTWITPIAVSPRDPHAIFQGAQVLFRSRDRGHSWEIISPDLSRAVAGTKGCDGAITVANAGPCGFGVIFSIALSPRTDDDIWIGTDDGLIQRTRDGGKTWTNVTPKGIDLWSSIASLDVSALDPETAYAAVDRHRLDDFTPHAWRTHDGGRSWTEIGAGLPADGFVDVVRTDPEQRGLLYAGTDTGAFVSFDDGDHWQPLQFDLPTTWVRDLLVHGNDLIAATQGRAIWILDDVSPLRQSSEAAKSSSAHLFHPAPAFRLRRSEGHDTPLPPETPLGENPPAGAIIDYWLPSAVSGPVAIEILDAKGAVVRRYSSDDPPETLKVNRYFSAAWLKPAALPSREAGHHRFVWDLRYPRPKAAGYEYSIAAIWGKDTPADPEGPLVGPGTYTVRLAAAGKTETQPLVVKMDPRVSVAPEAIGRQLEVARDAAAELDRSYAAVEELGAYRKKVSASGPPPAKGTADPLAAFEGAGGFARLHRRFAAVYDAVESADAPPTAQAEAELQRTKSEFETLLAKWKEFQSR
jgi:photosystem II stability/assembly factor-like uncharacterized protein